VRTCHIESSNFFPAICAWAVKITLPLAMLLGSWHPFLEFQGKHTALDLVDIKILQIPIGCVWGEIFTRKQIGVTGGTGKRKFVV
jgi:hypothetical protein